MKLYSWNVNGIRAAERKGFFNWLEEEDADLVCLQEIRAQVKDIESRRFWPKPYFCFYFPAEKKGYSGVGILSKHKPKNVIQGLNSKEFDCEGRYLELIFNNFSIKMCFDKLFVLSFPK